MKELYETLRGQDIVIYGVADGIYFDLYQGLRRSHITQGIPDDILILFTQKLIETYNTIISKKKDDRALDGSQEEGAPLYQDVSEAARRMIIHPESDTIFRTSMFGETTMFDNENQSRLS